MSGPPRVCPYQPLPVGELLTPTSQGRDHSGGVADLRNNFTIFFFLFPKTAAVKEICVKNSYCNAYCRCGRSKREIKCVFLRPIKWYAFNTNSVHVRVIREVLKLELRNKSRRVIPKGFYSMSKLNEGIAVVLKGLRLEIPLGVGAGQKYNVMLPAKLWNLLTHELNKSRSIIKK